MWSFLYAWASPPTFYRLSGYALPWLSIAACVLIGYGCIMGLGYAPSDYQQGEGFRIIYVHVPSAFLSLFIYCVMAAMALIAFIWRIKLCDIVIQASAPIGAWFTFLALVTGSLWGKPMWGTWWIWDARLTSELILFFLYAGVIALQSAIPDRTTAARAVNLLILVGSVNIPIIHYSVYWWNTLHQGATISRWGNPLIANDMLYPLLAMIVGFLVFYKLALLLRVRTELILREQKSAWVKEVIKSSS